MCLIVNAIVMAGCCARVFAGVVVGCHNYFCYFFEWAAPLYRVWFHFGHFELPVFLVGFLMPDSYVSNMVCCCSSS